MPPIDSQGLQSDMIDRLSLPGDYITHTEVCFPLQSPRRHGAAPLKEGAQRRAPWRPGNGARSGTQRLEKTALARETCRRQALRDRHLCCCSRVGVEEIAQKIGKVGEQRAGTNGRAPTRLPSIRAAASKLSHRSSTRSACLCGGALPAWAWVSLRKRSARVGGRASHRRHRTSAHPLAEHSSCCIEAQPPTQQCSLCPCGSASDLVETVRMLCAGCPARIVPVLWDERTACDRPFEPRRPSPVPRARGGVAAGSSSLCRKESFPFTPYIHTPPSYLFQDPRRDLKPL